MPHTEEPNLDKYKFLEAIKPIETWVMITECYIAHHTDCDSPYFQTELEGLALDGGGDLYQCSIHIPVEEHERARVEQFPIKYAKGSLHLIKSQGYSIKDYEVRFHLYETEPVPDGFGRALRAWFESKAECRVTNIKCSEAFFKMLE